MTFNRKALGKLGENVAVRILRDLGYKPLTQDEEFYLPGFDIHAIKANGMQIEKEFWVQVKATSKNYKNGYKIHLRQLMKMHEVASQFRKAGKPVRYILIVVSIPKEMVYVFSDKYVEHVICKAQIAKGDGPEKGMQVLKWTNHVWAGHMTRSELSDAWSIIHEDEKKHKFTDDLL